MSQFLSQVPRQLLRQEQRLTPQLIQAMDILQLPLLALESRIDQELDSNPALEVVDPEPERDEGADEGAELRGEGERALEVHEGDADDFNRLDSLVREYDYLDDELEYSGTRSRGRLAEDGAQKLDAMQNTAARAVGLHDYLLDQWRLSETTDRRRALGELLITHVDDHGRLDAPLEEIGAEATPPAPVSELETVLRAVQQLDPPGVAARTVQESLLLQLKALPEDTAFEQRLLRSHFEDLQRNRLPAIAKGMGVDLDEIKAALDSISRLRLNPVAEWVEPAAPRIIPDLIVEYDEETDRYDVRLARSNQRELRISPEFRAALEDARDDKQARGYLKEKLEAAATLIDAVRFRRDRLLEVAKAVVAAQREFFDQGEQHLKVLRMSELAERFGCDPSTISRTVDEKYMDTPRGIYALRRFFTGGTESEDGEAVSWDSIKAKVQEIIDAEDKSNPLNDDEIVVKLQQQGIDIKRRTVAKYRAQLGIAPGRQRRQY